MMAKPWNEHRGTITKLYIQEGRTLEDTRNIMKDQYNFEASIRSYRQHFDIWEIGKYNCKKRDRRRRQSFAKTLPLSPPHSPSDVPGEGERSSPTSTSSSMSRRSSEQKPLPVLKQPQAYTAYFYDQVRAQGDQQVKIENNSRGPLWESLDTDSFRNSNVVGLPLIMNLQAGLLIEEHDRRTPEVLHRGIVEHLCKTQCRGMCLRQLCILGTASFGQGCGLPISQSEGIMEDKAV
ncbi:hypothetical protein FAUST_3399 [Fusarium austroamericanum]|uniref:Clr5 domain-containing protein n=1 Tax=Fusarium austroamericanum TaxID=282268 RepID=A0AAN6C595_FUSAU|nr:hypothetical protein FAUST_3399 [Fusarium austroamericanum]